MAIGKGGQAGSQNQNQFGNYNSSGQTNQTGTTDQTGTTNQTGTTVNTGSNTSTINPNAVSGWEDAWRGMQPGGTGFNPTQQTAVNWTNANLGGDSAGLAPVRQGLTETSDWFNNMANGGRSNPTLRNLAELDPAAYGAPAPVTAQQVAGRSGADFMERYQNPYMKDVVDTSLADYDTGVDRAANSFRAQNLAGGSTGGAFGSNPVGAAILAGEAARGRGSLSSGLRSNAFNTAAGYGQADASRFQDADTGNANRTLSADTFNASLLDSRQKFDSDKGMQFNENQDQLMRDRGNFLGAAGNVGTQAYGINQGLASTLFGQGGAGAAQGLSWLNAGLPLFGQTSTGNNNQTGTTNQSGTTNQYGTTNQTGNSMESGGTFGSSNGSSRGKSGGIQIG